jgi:hypothetical protein
VSRDWQLIQEYEQSIIDLFTPAELVEFLDIPIETLVDMLWDSHIEDNAELRNYVFSA